MTQITLIKLGVIAIGIATVPLSLAQTPRTGTSGSNKTAATIGTAAGHTGLSGNFPSAVQTGTNFRGSTSTGPTANVGAHVGINAGAQTGISNSTGGIAGAAAGGLGSSSGNATGTTQIGTNARTGTNSTANTKAGAHAAAAAAAPARVTTILPQTVPVPFEAHCLTTAPSAQTSRLRGNPLRRTIRLGHPNSDSEPGAIALIRHWRLSQRGRTHERNAAFLVAELMQRFCKATINTCR